MRGVRDGLIVLLVLVARSPVVAQNDCNPSVQPAPTTVYLTTQAAVRLLPDGATVFLIVDAPADTPSAAAKRATALGQAVLDTLRRLGLGPRSAGLVNYGSTTSLALGGGAMPNPWGTFIARSVVRAELRRLDLLGPVMTAAASRGATLLGPIQFGVSASDSARRAAVAGAMAQARQEAEAMAQAAGGRLGRLLDVNSQANYTPDYNQPQLPLSGPQYQYEAQAAWRTAPEVVRSVSVSTRWEILQPGTGK